MNRHKRHSTITQPKRLQAEWQERVHQAELKYTQASAAAAKVQAEYKSQQPQTADRHYALQQALQVENDARHEYMRVLQIQTQLLVAGEIPKEK